MLVALAVEQAFAWIDYPEFSGGWIGAYPFGG